MKGFNKWFDNTRIVGGYTESSLRQAWKAGRNAVIEGNLDELALEHAAAALDHNMSEKTYTNSREIAHAVVSAYLSSLEK